MDPLHDHFAALGLPTGPDELDRIAAGGTAVTGFAGYEHRIWTDPSGVRVHVTDGPYHPDHPDAARGLRYRAAGYAGGPVSRVVPVSVSRDGTHPMGATLTLQPAVGSRPDLCRIAAVGADLAHTMHAWRRGFPVDVRLTCWPSEIVGAEVVTPAGPAGDGVRFAGIVTEDRDLVNQATGRAYRVSIVEIPGTGLSVAVCHPAAAGAGIAAPGRLVEVAGRVVVTYAGRPSNLVPASTGGWLMPILTTSGPVRPDPRTELARAVVAAFPHSRGVLAVCHRGDGGWEARRYRPGSTEPDFLLAVPHTPYHSTAGEDGIAVYGDGTLTVIRPDGPSYTTTYPPQKDCQVALGSDVTWLLLHRDEPDRPVSRWTLYRVHDGSAARAASQPPLSLPDIAESWGLPVVSPAGTTPVPMSRLARLDFSGERAFAALPTVLPDGSHGQCRITVGRTGPPDIQFAADRTWTRARIATRAGDVEHTNRDLTLAGQAFPPGPGEGYGSWRPLTPTLTAGVVDASDGQVVYLLQTAPGGPPVLHRHQVGTGYVSYAADATQPETGAWFMVDRFQRSEVYLHDLREGHAGKFDVDGSLRLISGDATAGEITAISVSFEVDPVLSLTDGTVGPFSAAPLQGTFGGIVLGTLVRLRIGDPR